MVRTKAQNHDQATGTVGRSKDGYDFNHDSSHWQLNKDVIVSVLLPHKLDDATERGFRASLQRYAEEFSARHTENMATRFKRYLRDTGASRVTTTDLINWRATLSASEEYHLGGLKGFLLAWHEYGFPGISLEVVDLLTGWRIRGNEKGVAVSSGCPETGPLTDLEVSAILDWANAAAAKKDMLFEDYAYLLTLIMTARRPVQIAALRGIDLVNNLENNVTHFSLNIPRAKQRGLGFRLEFRRLPITEDLALVLQEQHRRNVSHVEYAIGTRLQAMQAAEVPIFMNERVLDELADAASVDEALRGKTPDLLHATTAHLAESLRRICKASNARSERTGEFIRLTATRFRHTRGTKLRREGFGPFIIAELLDHSDIQNVQVYTQNTAQEAVIINELVGAQLAPFAQACMGRLVHSERDAIRGNDPHSRIPNGNQNAVGTCGSYGFCASGYRACYTCNHFQPWIHGPHKEVLADLYAEKVKTRSAGCPDVIVNANDHLILAVEHCVLMCAAAEKPLLSAEDGAAWA